MKRKEYIISISESDLATIRKEYRLKYGRDLNPKLELQEIIRKMRFTNKIVTL